MSDEPEVNRHFVAVVETTVYTYAIDMPAGVSAFDQVVEATDLAQELYNHGAEPSEKRHTVRSAKWRFAVSPRK